MNLGRDLPAIMQGASGLRRKPYPFTIIMGLTATAHWHYRSIQPLQSSSSDVQICQHPRLCSLCCTIVAKPSIPLRRSVYPQAIYTLSAPLKSFSMTAAPLSGFLSVLDSFPDETRYTHPRSTLWRNIPIRSATPVSALAALQKPASLASALHLPLCSVPHAPIDNMSSLISRFLRTTSLRTARCFCTPESLPPISVNAPRALIRPTSCFLPPNSNSSGTSRFFPVHLTTILSCLSIHRWI